MSRRGFTHEAPVKGGTDEWFTPQWVFDAMQLSFDVDPCAPPLGAEGYVEFATRRIDRAQNGLITPWGDGRAFVNWPYSESPKWVDRVLQHWSVPGNTAITLCFNRCETEWAQRLMSRATAVLFLAGRIQFVAGNNEIAIPVLPDDVTAQILADLEKKKVVVAPFAVDNGRMTFKVSRADHRTAMAVIKPYADAHEVQIDAQPSGSAGAGNMLCAYGVLEAAALARMARQGLGVLVVTTANPNRGDA